MEKVLVNVIPASLKIKAALEKLQAEEVELAEKLKEASQVARALADVAALEAWLGSVALADVTAGTKGEFVHVPAHVEEQSVEDWAEQILEFWLSAYQQDVKRVKETMLGTCSKCRWQSGCHSCTWWKCVRYWRMVETKGKRVEGYSEAYRKLKLEPKKAVVVKGGGVLESRVAEQKI